jgi:hypothetical protein
MRLLPQTYRAIEGFRLTGKDANLTALVRQEEPMPRDSATTDRLRVLISKIEALTEGGNLRWERQAGSAHRYASWSNNLLILGPATPLSDASVPRYLFITPFDSPDHIEVNTDDPVLGADVLKLVDTVENASVHEPPTDPFAVTEQMLERLESL